jgi:signal transduction histidine kinase
MALAANDYFFGLTRERLRATPAGPNVVEFPVRAGLAGRHALVFALATAGDLDSVVVRLAEWLDRTAGVSRVEWWSPDDAGRPELLAASGSPRATRQTLALGPAGDLVLHGGRCDAELGAVLLSLVPILRRRVAEERLTRAAMKLARRNEALEDFAALVAHELKTPLHAALLGDDPSGPLEAALELVETLLQAARGGSSDRSFACVAECLDQAVADLRTDLEVTAELATTLPLPPGSLRVILRNLVSNAVAAGAHRVHLVAQHSPGSFRLLVDDDGSGPADDDRYATGSGLGLALCRRIAGRFGGELRLAPRAAGGARATLEFAEASG